MKKESDDFANKDEKTNVGTSVLKKKRNLWFYVSLVFFFSTIGVYFWKEYQINQTKKTYTLKANDLLNKKTQEMLKAFTKPLTWAIRADITRGNNEQVNLLYNDLVKLPNITMLNFIDTKNVITASTDKNFEGKSATSIFDKSLSSTTSFLIQQKSESEWLIASPVNGFDKKLGTIVYKYKNENIILD